jgi:hypothetical protein
MNTSVSYSPLSCWRWTLNWSFLVAACLFAVGIFAKPALAQPSKRVALVIGNADYKQQDRLRNPISDAQLMAQTFRTLGFDRVDLVTEADQLKMLTAISEFRNHASGAGLAVIYFSGHGMKHGAERQNYLLPIDMPSLTANAALNPDIVLQSKAISEGSLLDVMGSAQYQLLILDACRDNADGTKSGNKGLGRRPGVGAALMRKVWQSILPIRLYLSYKRSTRLLLKCAVPPCKHSNR